MFVHAVLFEIKATEVAKYRRDCLIWARYAKRALGFVSYSTMKRVNAKGQYASVYKWKSKKDHDRFMKELHDWLVSESRARVKVLGYYNMKVDR